MSHPAGCHCQGPLDTCCSKDHDPDPAGGRRVDVLIEDFCSRRDKIIRQMLYGSPSEGEADLRIDIMDHTRSFLEEQIKMPPDKVP